MPPQKRSTPTGSPSMSPIVESEPLIGNRPRRHQKGEKNYQNKLDHQGKAWAPKAQQDWPVNVAINSRLLDMQGTKIWRD
jgi:hypothetical protein